MRERIYNFALNKPWITLLISILLVFSAAFGAQNLVFKGDYKVFFSEQNPELTAFESIQEIYAKSDNVAFILAPKNGDIFTFPKGATRNIKAKTFGFAYFVVGEDYPNTPKSK